MAFRTPLIRQNRRCRAIGENNSSENGVFFTIDRLWRSHGECRVEEAVNSESAKDSLRYHIRIKKIGGIYNSFPAGSVLFFHYKKVELDTKIYDNQIFQFLKSTKLAGIGSFTISQLQNYCQFPPILLYTDPINLGQEQ